MADNNSTSKTLPRRTARVSNDASLTAHEESPREKRTRELTEEMTRRLRKVVNDKRNNTKIQGEAQAMIHELHESFERKARNVPSDKIFEQELTEAIRTAEIYLKHQIERDETKEAKEKAEKERKEREEKEHRARLRAMEEPESAKDEAPPKPKGKIVEQTQKNTSIPQPSPTIKRGGFGVPSQRTTSPVPTNIHERFATANKRSVAPKTSMRDRHASSRTSAHAEKPEIITHQPKEFRHQNIKTNSSGIINHQGKPINPSVRYPKGVFTIKQKPTRKMGIISPSGRQLPPKIVLRKPMPSASPSFGEEHIEVSSETTEERPFGNIRSDSPESTGYTERGDAVIQGGIAGGTTGAAMGGFSGSNSGGGGNVNTGGGTTGGGNGIPRIPNIMPGRLGQRGHKKKNAAQKLEKKLEKRVRNEVLKKAAASLMTSPWFWVVVGVIILILLILALVMQEDNKQENPLKITKTGPTEAKLNDTLVYNISVNYPGSADNVTITDPIPQGTTYVSSSPSGTLNGTTITWDAKALNLPLTNPISIAITLTLKSTQDNLKIGNVANATVTGGTAGQTGAGGGGAGYAAPSDNNCGGKYTFKAPLGKNFGDPNCDFSKDKLYTQLKQEDPANADVWFNKVVPCESGYNPNAYAGPQTGTPDAAGAWGLFQMGSASPAGNPPPAPGKNGPNDRGDVPWGMQADNATTYGKKIGSLGAYWACAR